MVNIKGTHRGRIAFAALYSEPLRLHADGSRTFRFWRPMHQAGLAVCEAVPECGSARMLLKPAASLRSRVLLVEFLDLESPLPQKVSIQSKNHFRLVENQIFAPEVDHACWPSEDSDDVPRLLAQPATSGRLAS
jgi:hypothetical protein